MTDEKLWQAAVSAGGFGVLALLLVYYFVKERPAERAAQERRDAEFAAAIKAQAGEAAAALKAQSADNRSTKEMMAAAHERTVATIMAETRSAMAAQIKECREERADMARRYDEQAERDRVVRHEMANRINALWMALHTAGIRIPAEEPPAEAPAPPKRRPGGSGEHRPLGS